MRRLAYSRHRTALAAAAAALLALPAGALAAGDPVIAAAGDISCDPANSSYNGGNGTPGACRERATSDMLVGAGYSAVLPLGDNQYYCGGLGAYLQAYNPTWGRVKAISHPVVGNHEYLTTPGGGGATGCNAGNTDAAGHFGYWGALAGPPDKGYYSYNIGSWHLIAVNSNCGNVDGCTPTSPQGQWLAADLAANTTPCTLAYWHIPLFSSGGRAARNTATIWTQLTAAKVDVVLNGHDHIYERFAPQTADGAASADGPREFIVGTGGANHTSITTVAANSLVRDATTFGVLQLTLHNGSYDWRFLPEPGGTFTDSGSATCHPQIKINLRVRVLRTQRGVRRVTARLIRPVAKPPYLMLRVDGAPARVRVRIALVGSRGRKLATITRRIPTNRPVRLGGVKVPATIPSLRVTILG